MADAVTARMVAKIEKCIVKRGYEYWWLFHSRDER